MQQVTLTGDKPNKPDNTNEISSEKANTSHTVTSTAVGLSAVLAPVEQRGDDGCCPWCLASPETFEQHDNGSVGCGHCEAIIPIGVDWYERGEKIVL